MDNFKFPDRTDYRYPVITYSINTRYAVYQKFNWLMIFWRWLLRKDPVVIGQHIDAEVCLCEEALRYFQVNDVIQIGKEEWFVHGRGQGFLNVRTLQPTCQIVPISIGDQVFKLYSTWRKQDDN